MDSRLNALGPEVAGVAGAVGRGIDLANAADYAFDPALSCTESFGVSVSV